VDEPHTVELPQTVEEPQTVDDPHTVESALMTSCDLPSEPVAMPSGTAAGEAA
jgi:hypothetical protein